LSSDVSTQDVYKELQPFPPPLPTFFDELGPLLPCLRSYNDHAAYPPVCFEAWFAFPILLQRPLLTYPLVFPRLKVPPLRSERFRAAFPPVQSIGSRTGWPRRTLHSFFPKHFEPVPPPWLRTVTPWDGFRRVFSWLFNLIVPPPTPPPLDEGCGKFVLPF